MLGLFIALQTRREVLAQAGQLLAAIPPILILSPLSYFLFVGLTLNVITLIAIGVLMCVGIAVTVPLLCFVAEPLRMTVPSILAAALGLFLAGLHFSRFNAEHPLADNLVYAINGDGGKAKWISYDAAPDRWTKQFLGSRPDRRRLAEFTGGSEREVLSTDAPNISLEKPSVAVTEDTTVGGIRNVQLHLISPRHASSIFLRLPAQTDLVSAAWNGRGQELRSDGELATPWTLRYEAVPPEGADLRISIRGGGRLTCWLADSSQGLPQLPGEIRHGRPPDLMAGSGSDITLVSRQITF